MNLQSLLRRSATDHPNRIAIEDGVSTTSITYRELDNYSDRLRDHLLDIGVRPKDCVGIYLSKSIDSVVCIFGILKAGAAYVPVDATAPIVRNAFILSNCSVSAVIIDQRFEDQLLGEFVNVNYSSNMVSLPVEAGGLVEFLKRRTLRAGTSYDSCGDDIAYVLYTSGTTGSPKGVVVSHRNARSFVDWCFATIEPSCDDRFSSHAPFHFDLSILDIYTAIGSGATLILISGNAGKDPVGLAKLISDKEISVWYSAPSILSLMAQYGDLDRYAYDSLRMVLFAGEVFPIVHLRNLKNKLSNPRYLNLYGPTETNVCTFFEIPKVIPAERQQPYPIGKICPHLEGIVIDQQGNELSSGEEGELCISGDSVMVGYWELREQTKAAFLHGRSDGTWYRTGDLVVEESDGNLTFKGRRDRMIKKRGYRVELGEIEACLYRHEEIQEAAVVATSNESAEVTISAHIATISGQKQSLIALKRFCSQHLPLYMIPDEFWFHDLLPKTSTDKVDYQSLRKPDTK